MPIAIDNKTGLRLSDFEEIRHVLAQHSEIEKAFLFGSRAKGTYRPTSDVDIALEGTAVTNALAWDVRYALLEDCWMPYRFDVVALQKVANSTFRAAIEADKLLIYEAS
jgi:uncharacterized protein